MNEFSDSDKYLLLDNLFNLFLDDKYQPEDDKLFEEWDIDIDSILDKNTKLFRQLQTRAQAELNEMKHKRVQKFLFKLKEGLQSKIEGYEELANEILSQPKFAKLQPMFRNLSDITEKDKKSILWDAKILGILSEIEKEYSGKLNDE